MSDWDDSAEAWIRKMGTDGDWGRIHVLDPAMLARIEGRGFGTALDVGCGEGRFCRMLRARGIAATGIDPTARLIAEARARDPDGDYVEGRAEALPFDDARFDLVVSYLSLIDIEPFREAIAEMARVLRPGGTLLVASMSSVYTAGPAAGWIRDAEGRRVSFPVDRYMEERGERVEFAGVEIVNWHRPLSAYMSAFLDAGLALRAFEEPLPVGADPEASAAFCRVPWFVVMAWEKPG